MNTLTIRINTDWYAMAGGKVAKAGSKAVRPTQPATEAPEAPWVPVLRISEQIAYEAKQRQIEALAAREMGFLPA